MEIRLRAMEPDDIDLLYEAENDAASWAAGATTMPYSRDILRQYILSTTGDIFTDKQARLIIESSTGEALGIADITGFDPKNRRAEVGIIVLPRHRNKGIATQAMALVEEYARRTVHLHQLFAVVPDSNAASRQLFEKCRYVCAAELKDWLFSGDKYQNARLMQKIL